MVPPLGPPPGRPFPHLIPVAHPFPLASLHPPHNLHLASLQVSSHAVWDLQSLLQWNHSEEDAPWRPKPQGQIEARVAEIGEGIHLHSKIEEDLYTAGDLYTCEAWLQGFSRFEGTALSLGPRN